MWFLTESTEEPTAAIDGPAIDSTEGALSTKRAIWRRVNLHHPITPDEARVRIAPSSAFAHTPSDSDYLTAGKEGTMWDMYEPRRGWWRPLQPGTVILAGAAARAIAL